MLIEYAFKYDKFEYEGV